jgi:hypothetical protein
LLRDGGLPSLITLLGLSIKSNNYVLPYSLQIITLSINKNTSASCTFQERKLQMFENRVLRINVPKREEVTEG